MKRPSISGKVVWGTLSALWGVSVSLPSGSFLRASPNHFLCAILLGASSPGCNVRVNVLRIKLSASAVQTRPHKMTSVMDNEADFSLWLDEFCFTLVTRIVTG